MGGGDTSSGRWGHLKWEVGTPQVGGGQEHNRIKVTRRTNDEHELFTHAQKSKA